jgi:hypothetical protein
VWVCVVQECVSSTFCIFEVCMATARMSPWCFPLNATTQERVYVMICIHVHAVPLHAYGCKSLCVILHVVPSFL